MEIFVFEAAGEFLGLDARHVHQIADDVAVSPVPFLPTCHRGLIHYRGELYDLVDMGTLMGKAGSEDASGSYVILLKWEQHRIGLIPDRIVGLKWIEEEPVAGVVHTRAAETVRLVTPEGLWQSLLGLNYGPRKV